MNHIDQSLCLKMCSDRLTDFTVSQSNSTKIMSQENLSHFTVCKIITFAILLLPQKFHKSLEEEKPISDRLPPPLSCLEAGPVEQTNSCVCCKSVCLVSLGQRQIFVFFCGALGSQAWLYTSHFSSLTLGLLLVTT